MIAKVTEHGILVPRRLLKGIMQVEIRQSRKRITLVPVSNADPIRKLGRKPVRCGLNDGSVRHDDYLYGRAA